MTDSEISEMVDDLITRALEANDAGLAAAERHFYQAAGLSNGNDAIDWALGNLAGAIGSAYTQAAREAFWVGAFWASSNASTNGR